MAVLFLDIALDAERVPIELVSNLRRPRAALDAAILAD